MWWPFRIFTAQQPAEPVPGGSALPKVVFDEVIEHRAPLQAKGGTISQRYGLLAQFPDGTAGPEAPLSAWLDCAAALSQAAPLLGAGERVVLSAPERLGATPLALSRALEDLVQHGSLKGLEPGQIAFRLTLPTPGPGTTAEILVSHGLCLIPEARFLRRELVVCWREEEDEPPLRLSPVADAS